jgi:putative ABC transport system ATP-binding protein
MVALITLEGVDKTYAGSSVPALAGVSLQIEAGAITAITGPSGCGKSTLLNLIGGLDRPSHGRIEVNGIAVERLSEAASARFRRTTVGLVFQFFHLIEDLSVVENVLVPARLAGAKPREAAQRATTLLTELGLADVTERFPATLSGGQRQRVAIARAVINRPTLLLADEPTGALDTRNGEIVLGILEDLHRQGQTIVLVTHDEHLAARIADRRVHLIDGAISTDTTVNRMAA